MKKRNLVTLVEERGVAAIMFRNMAEKILQDASKKASEAYLKGFLSKTNPLEYTVSKDLIPNVSFAQNFVVRVQVTEYGNEAYDYSGSGSAYGRYMPWLVDKKLYYAEMNLNCFSDKGKIVNRQIKLNFYHEMNHLLDRYFRLLHTNNDESFRETAQLSNTGNNGEIYSDIKIYNSTIKDLIYRLLSDTEINALVAQIYGDLDGMGSKRENYRKDIKETVTYIIYSRLKNNYEAAIDSMNTKQTLDLMKDLKPFKITFKTQNPEIFKNRLKELIAKKLNKLYRRMCAAASCWYDSSEKRFNDDLLTEVIVHFDKNIKLI